MGNYVTVIGGVNIDINGTSCDPLVLADSNPGKINISYGGVGRNIAENLARLGIKVELITTLGDDAYAYDLRNACERMGIGMDHSLMIPNQNTSIYLCINNNDGDMAIAINDMKIYDFMTVDYIKKKLDVINNSSYVILETNVPQDVIEFICNNSLVPVIVDPVSVKKASKLKNVLDKIYCIKPNVYEAELLSGIQIRDTDNLPLAASKLLEKGIQNVFISMGEEGVYYANKNKQGHCNCWIAPVVNTTGCGDSLVAAITWGMMRQFDVDMVALAGTAAASVCASAETTISPEISEARLCEMLKL